MNERAKLNHEDNGATHEKHSIKLIPWLTAGGLLLGFLAGTFNPVEVPLSYTRYLSVALLACLDSVLGGWRAAIEKKFNNMIFVSGFFTNALLAVLLVYMGDKLAVDLYLAAVVAFGVRLFNNLAIIRRLLIERLHK